jgi:acyl CoA:acetate/3-ketoacid CoA transferase alpha subunit
MRRTQIRSTTLTTQLLQAHLLLASKSALSNLPKSKTKRLNLLGSHCGGKDKRMICSLACVVFLTTGFSFCVAPKKKKRARTQIWLEHHLTPHDNLAF